jgi:hypothetical protein
MLLPSIDPWIAAGVTATTAIADAAYVMFTSAVAARRRISAANWGGMVYLLSAFAVISYAHSWVYVLFAAIGSWVGAYISMIAARARPPSTTVEPPSNKLIGALTDLEPSLDPVRVPAFPTSPTE